MENEKKGLSIASLIFGILGILMCSLGFIPSIIGLILAIVAKKKKNAGPSTLGMILSIIGAIISFIAGIVAIIVISTMGIGGIAAAIGGSATEPDIYDSPYTYEDPYDYPIDYADPAEGTNEYDDPVDYADPADNEGTPDYQNNYVRLYQQADGTVKILIDNEFPSYTYFDYCGCSLEDIYDSCNAARAMDGMQPIPEELFYQVLTATLCDDGYFAASDEQTATQIEVYTAIVAQAVSYTLDICPDAKVAYAVQQPGEIYTIYFDNGYSMTYNCITDNTLEGYPFYVNFDVNGTAIDNRCKAETVAVYMYAIENSSDFAN